MILRYLDDLLYKQMPSVPPLYRCPNTWMSIRQGKRELGHNNADVKFLL